MKDIRTKSQAGKNGTRRGEQVRGKLYFRQPDNIPSPDAPSLHHTAHCEDKASSAGQPVDFPLSLSQRGLACPYISRSGHANSDGNPSAATQTTQL